MFCTASSLLGWRDFPKGLRVLLLDEDSSSSAELKSKLEEMDYIVSVFCNENEALMEITNKPESFHIAIVEVNASNCGGPFKFLEVAKDLPTIATSRQQCLSTMMRCIALGAVEFLLKPLSHDKLRNIWQHVVHKAFNTGGKDLSDSLKPVKESVTCMLNLQLENGERKSKNCPSVDIEHKTTLEDDQEKSGGSDKYPAPLTPQLSQGVRLADDGDSKSVDITHGDDVAAESPDLACPAQITMGPFVQEEDVSSFACKSQGNMSSSPQNEDGLNDSGGDAGNSTKIPRLQSSRGIKANKKKMKVDWTPELHKKFVKAVEKLGVNQAIPSRILELMKVEGLTRHNVASHLQKYRFQQRHILPKEDSRNWPNPRDHNYYPHKPVMTFPLRHSIPNLPPGQVYPAWGTPGSYLPPAQTWCPTFYPPWQPAESWHWKPYPGLNADAWGCPVMPLPPHGLSYPQSATGLLSVNTMHGRYGISHNSFDLHHPAEEVIDKVVKEALNKPWLPLPIGLKSPSTDTVLAELSKQGEDGPYFHPS
ncbi:hypothetical protein NMG60_11030156 [Bertholletia excelsa]